MRYKLKTKSFWFLVVVLGFFFWVLGLYGSLVSASHTPAPTGFVNDFANLFSHEFRQTLEQDLQKFEKETGAEIAIATVNSLGGVSIEDFAVRLFEEWGIGKKGKDNGVLLLIAKEDREVRIEVGYGLEPFITDGRAGDIIRNAISPNFQREDYEQGLNQALERIKGYVLSGEPEDTQESLRRTIGNFFPYLFFGDGIGFFFFILIVVYLFDFLARSKSYWLGGVFGTGLGLFLSWLYLSFLVGVVSFIFLGGIGLFIDYILSRNYQRRKELGLPTGFWASKGGFSSGGSRGFGGFGGGLSGGGGASGRW